MKYASFKMWIAQYLFRKSKMSVIRVTYEICFI